jgi:hypothetical protein
MITSAASFISSIPYNIFAEPFSWKSITEIIKKIPH